MVLPGHLAGGYLGAVALLAITHAGVASGLSHEQINVLLVLGTLAGELPDLDLLRLHYEETHGGRKVESHRNYFTHAPSFWLLVSLVVVGCGYIFSSAFTELIGGLILTGSWSHLIFDSIEDGVMWLWPFNTKRFDIVNKTYQGVDGGPHSMRYYWNFIIREYSKLWTCYAEIFVMVVAIWALTR